MTATMHIQILYTDLQTWKLTRQLYDIINILAGHFCVSFYRANFIIKFIFVHFSFSPSKICFSFE